MSEFDKFEETDTKQYPLVYVNSKDQGILLPAHADNVICVHLPKNEWISAGIPFVNRKRFDSIIGTYTCTTRGDVIVHPVDERLAKRLPDGFSLGAQFMVDKTGFFIAIEEYIVDLYQAPKSINKVELGDLAVA